MWPRSEQDQVLPPKLRKMPGRPKKKRRKEFHEIVSNNRLTREGRIMTCHVCKSKGHNSRNKKCPGKPISSSQASEISNPTTPKSNQSSSQASEISNPTTPRSTQSSQRPTHGSGSRLRPRQSTVTGSQIEDGVQVGHGSTSSMVAAVQGSNKYVSLFHKECRPKLKPKKRTLLTGMGLYINPQIGRSILNPRISMARVVDFGNDKSGT